MKNAIILLSALILTSLTVFSQWTQKDDFGGTGRACTVGFSIGSKGYIGLGCDFVSTMDFWEYDQNNVWTRKTDFPGNGYTRCKPFNFSIGTKGYIGGGWDLATNTTYKDFWEWDQATDTWTQKADFGRKYEICSRGFFYWHKRVCRNRRYDTLFHGYERFLGMGPGNQYMDTKG